METKNNAIPDFHAVTFMREQRNKLSEFLSKMTTEEIVEYFKRKRELNHIKPSA
jgi:hypothetical protein